LAVPVLEPEAARDMATMYTMVLHWLEAAEFLADTEGCLKDRVVHNSELEKEVCCKSDDMHLPEKTDKELRYDGGVGLRKHTCRLHCVLVDTEEAAYLLLTSVVTVVSRQHQTVVE
jgi:hypothetical protein